MYKKIARCNDLWIGEKMSVVIDGIPVLIVHTETGIFAYQNICPHAGACLSEGSFKEDKITCARHHWQFDANTGKGINPKETALRRYPIWIDEENNLWIDIDHAPDKTI